MTVTVDIAKQPVLLTALRLSTFARLWPEFCERVDKEGWPAERLLAALCEPELSEGVSKAFATRSTRGQFCFAEARTFLDGCNTNAWR